MKGKPSHITVYLATPKEHRRVILEREDYFHQINQLIFDDPRYHDGDAKCIEGIDRYVNGKKYIIFLDSYSLMSGKWGPNDVMAMSAESSKMGMPLEVILGRIVISKSTKGGDIGSLTDKEIKDFEFYFDTEGGLIYRFSQERVQSPNRPVGIGDGREHLPSQRPSPQGGQ